MIDNLDMEVILDTDNPYDVAEALKHIKNTGLYFLDVHLNSDITGIELAKKVREYDPRGFIVIISAFPEHKQSVFTHRLEVMDYIDKSDFGSIRERIEACVRDANTRFLRQTSVIHNVLRIKWKEKVISVEFNDIISIETSGNKNDHLLILNTPETSYTWTGSLKAVEDRLDKNRFCKVSQSFIINKEYVQEFIPRTRMLYMKHGGKFLVPINMVNKLKKLLTDSPIKK
jgi:two-component system response regulator AgrA